MNTVTLEGTIEHLKAAGSGNRFSLSVPREGRTDFDDRLPCIAWEAELLPALADGARVRVEGRLQKSSWTDKQTGERKYSVEVLVTGVTVPREAAPASS